LVCIYSREPG